MASDEFLACCKAADNRSFFAQPADKWSIAQNVTHLITSTRITSLAFRLPKFIVRLYGGTPNRPSRTYDELVEKYKLKLQQGGRASGPFIPKSVPASAGKENIVAIFETKMNRLIAAIENNWKDHQLDQYLAPHPLLGKITLRELCFFTIYHTYHHLIIIRSRLS